MRACNRDGGSCTDYRTSGFGNGGGGGSCTDYRTSGFGDGGGKNSLVDDGVESVQRIGQVEGHYFM